MDSIILASSSPRRKELLETMQIQFKVIPANCDESVPEEIRAMDAPLHIAEKKAKAIIRQLNSDETANFVLAADTAIVFDGKVYGKPRGIDEAKSFISLFQGKTQSVVTGVALYNRKKALLKSEAVVTNVKFKKMTSHDIDFCLSKNEWKDAAGGYKIQGVSACFIEKIEGSYSNVVCLPIEKVYDMLSEQHFEF